MNLLPIQQVPLARIRPNPDQPRDTFDPARLAELAASIRQYGVLLPLVGYAGGADGTADGSIVLVAGERRLRAAGLAGLETVPVRLLAEAPSPLLRLELALIENLQRADLDPLEAAAGCQRLIQQHGYTHEQVAERVGMERASVSNLLRLLRLPEEGQAALRSGRISAGHARALVGISDPERFRALLNRTIKEHLSVRAVERLAAQEERSGQRGDQRGGPGPASKGSMERLERHLCRIWGGRVQVQENQEGGGRIVLHYRDAEDRERILSLMEGA